MRPVGGAAFLGAMYLHLDDRACVLSGVCAALAPDRFALRSDETVLLVAEVADDADDADVVADAIACCPGAALSLEPHPVVAPGRPS